MPGRTWFRSIVFVLVVFTQSLIAHHADGPEFDANRIVSVTGKLAKLEWNNPHAFAHIEITRNGSTVHWSGEVGPPRLHLILGWTPEGVRSLVGQTVTMRGHPAKDGANRMSSLSLKTGKGAVLSRQIKTEKNGEMSFDGVKVRAENGVLVVVPN